MTHADTFLLRRFNRLIPTRFDFDSTRVRQLIGGRLGHSDITRTSFTRAVFAVDGCPSVRSALEETVTEIAMPSADAQSFDQYVGERADDIRRTVNEYREKFR